VCLLTHQGSTDGYSTTLRFKIIHFSNMVNGHSYSKKEGEKRVSFYFDSHLQVKHALSFYFYFCNHISYKVIMIMYRSGQPALHLRSRMLLVSMTARLDISVIFLDLIPRYDASECHIKCIGFIETRCYSLIWCVIELDQE